MDAELTVGLLAARFDDEYPDAAPDWVAAKAVRNIAAAERTRLLADLLAARIEARRRARIRDIEQRATQADAIQSATAESQAEAEAYLAEHATRCEITHRGYNGGNGYYAAQACDKRKYKESPEGLAAAAEWREARAESRRRRLEEAEKEALLASDPDEYRRRYPSPWEMLTRHMEEYRSKVRLELTVELLGSKIALGDGRLTTWGRATVADHEQRIELLMRNIEGSGHTIVLHEKAIEILEERNAACLSDVRFAA